MSKHNQSKHKVVKYYCDQCDGSFTRKENLSKHKQSRVVQGSLGVEMESLTRAQGSDGSGDHLDRVWRSIELSELR